MNETIVYQREGQVATLYLNKPERHNSLGKRELGQLMRHFQVIASDKRLRVLVITGIGDDTFCAGASITELQQGLISGADFQRTTDLLAGLNIPTLCALNGSVYGGGAELALSCDFRLGVKGMVMRVPAAAIGICYPISGIFRFVQRLGVPMAKRVLMGAERFDDESLLNMGFVDELVEPEQLHAVAQERAQGLAKLAPLAVSGMKEIIREATAGAINQQHAQTLIRRCEQSGDFQEGMLAQREGREPRFSGR